MSPTSIKEFKRSTQKKKILSAPPIAPSGAELHRLIAAPKISGDLETVLNALSVHDICFECEGDGPLAQHPGFPGALRQQIGTELLKTASREALGGLSCPWEPACGLQVFFNSKNPVSKTEMPLPWVIRTQTVDANCVRITLRLFGLGLLWSRELAEACHRAIETGIFIGGIGPICENVIIRSTEPMWSDFPDPVVENGLALVSFFTPFQGDSNLNDECRAAVGQQFLEDLAQRAIDVGRWHGIDLEWDRTQLGDCFDECTFEDVGLGDFSWSRSISQKYGASFPMTGKLGLLQIRVTEKARPTIYRLLRLGELLHAGGNLSFGQGRFDLFFASIN